MPSNEELLVFYGRMQALIAYAKAERYSLDRDIIFAILGCEENIKSHKEEEE